MTHRRRQPRQTGLCIAVAMLFLLALAAGCVRVAPPTPAGTSAVKSQESAREGVEADAVIEKWRRALGGSVRLATLRNLERQWLVRAGTGPASSLHTIEAGLERMSYEEIASGEIVNQGGYDGRVDWCDMGERGVGYQVTPSLQYRFWHAPSTRAVMVDRQYARRRVLQTEGEADATVVLGMTAPDGIDERWTFERISGHLLRIERQNGSARLVVTYSDYRICDGLAVPFSVLCETGVAQVTYRCLSAAVNMDVTGVEFSPPKTFLQKSEPLDQIIRRHVEVRGGAQAWRMLTSRVTKATVSSSSSTAPTQLLVRQKGANRILAETDQPGLGAALLASDGKSAWENSEIRGFRPLKGADASRPFLYASMAADPVSVESYPLRKSFGRQTLNGRETAVVQVSSHSAAVGKFFFAVDDGTLLCFESAERPPEGGAPSRIMYSDFRRTGDVTMPFQIEYITSEEHTTVRCQSIEHGVALDDTLFVPPSR